MELTPRQTDRAAGVLLAQACGDALGVPYEFAPGHESDPVMKGGGLGPYSPGEWSDDTQMALCIVRIAATGADLESTEALDEIADSFVSWSRTGATDVGTQTRRVLDATRPSQDEPLSATMARHAASLHHRTGRTAGNGALMRTSVVGLSALADREATARRARAVAELTHADPLAGDSCVIWSDLVRHAVLTGELDVPRPLDLLPPHRRDDWAARLDEAVRHPDPARYSANGFTVVALQAALAAVEHAHRTATGARRLRRGLIEAVGGGHDTDTVAAIAGGLLGALHGASAVPATWRRQVHGWPGMRGRDLIQLGVSTARGDCDDTRWPGIRTMDYTTQLDAGRPLGVTHPHDDGVVIGTLADLGRLDDLGVDAVVSLCRRGVDDVPAPHVAPEDHVEVWLIDSESPEGNADLDFVLDDAAAAIEELRSEGRRVLVHCVAAQMRAPSVAARYSVRRGIPSEVAERDLCAVLPTLRDCDALLWASALQPLTSSTREATQ
ncbi:ADP-ribosylglycohydrolase family protein [Fodinibacter luteus]|uniref:ADP-ribosylglycohydrolase family protein n=1 Tax=Fodinibacter luteus TaxID=552064 RepID=A0ABP8KBS5_9MICO